VVARYPNRKLNLNTQIWQDTSKILLVMSSD